MNPPAFLQNFRTGLLATSLAVVPAMLCAQVYTPPAQQPSGQNGGNSGGTSTTVVQQGGGNQGNQQTAGNDLPWFDPATDTFSFDGKSFNVNDNRVFRARFEKFLNTEAATTEADRAYREAIQEILDTLSPHNRDPNKFPKAVAMLQRAAQFPQDAKLCDSLANAIYRVFLASQNAQQLRALNEKLNEERKKLDWNYEMEQQGSSLEKNRVLSSRQQAKNNKMNAEADKARGNPEATAAGQAQRYIQRIAETEAERVANKARIQLSEAEAKIEFQGLVVQYFMQRRFEHVIMGARFYTEFFKDGAGRLEFEEDENGESEAPIQQLGLKTTGFSPTITTLDTFANEAIRDVDQQVESFGYLVERDEIDSALRQLQQAFVTGEHLPSVQSIPREKKRAVLDYSRNAFQLTNAIEVKDYTLAESLVTEMREQASDFDHSKPTAAIEGAKLSSNMRIRSAKNAALKGDDEVFEENVAAAAEIWPSNPALKKEFNMIADSADVQQQAKIEFDRLLSTQSYRQIFTNQPRFMAALAEDPERLEALKQVLGNIQEIESVLKQAESLEKAGNPHAAWEIVEKTFQRFPDDVPLSARRSDLSTAVADFVRALTQARNLEGRRQRGSSLAWFLSARRIYPQSEFADEGIRRLVDEILPEEGEAGVGSGAESGEGPGDASASL